jgi:Na+/H+ antiporter NhaD/arsenite permease-like protein
VLGMMTGLGVLKLYGHYLNRRDLRLMPAKGVPTGTTETNDFGEHPLSGVGPGTTAAPAHHRDAFNIFTALQRAEWDTLMFFYGVILCVGGLGMLGYLALASGFLYLDMGATTANILIGTLSAIIDNIPLMYAVLTMNPDMSLAQWQLVTLTTGVGGSLLSIGSAAGVGVMGQARGTYTFFSHLKWSWAIALGYAGSVWVHLLLNS